jgi:5'-deoxynucleotidase YfbR-like HD superfamily hydrolase
MALVHDMGEIRAGDCDITLKRYTTRDEHAAVHDMFAGSSLEEFAAIYDEYEKFESPEARIVRDADLIESDLETREEQLMGNVGADYTFADK